MTRPRVSETDYFHEAALLALAHAEIAQQPETPERLRQHLNQEHGYTISADADVARWFTTLTREHQEKHEVQE